jgi:hypothetical protein
MFGRGLTVLLGVWLLAMPLAAVVSTKEAGPDNRNAELSEREQMYRRYQKSWDYVDGATEPHWRADGSSVWFAEDGPDNRVFYRVDPEAKTVTPVFDTPRVRAALELQLGHELPGKGLPFTEFRFVDDNERYVEFEVENQRFRLELGSHELSVAGTESAEET